MTETPYISKEGKERLLEILENKVKDIKRFKEGFYLSVKRNVESGTITKEEATTLLIKLENRLFI